MNSTNTIKALGGKIKRRLPPLKLHLRIDITTGQFDVFELTDAITADSTLEKACPELPPGSLRIVDLAYFSLETFDKLTKAGVYWITPLKVNCHLFDEAETPFLFENLFGRERTQNLYANTGSRRKNEKTSRSAYCPTHLPRSRSETPKTLEKTRQNERTYAPQKCDSNSQDGTCISPTLKNIRGTPAQIATLYSTRWQVELLFKCFKSVGKCNVSRSQKPYRRLCEDYAKLLIALMRHWIMLATGWRCIQHRHYRDSEIHRHLCSSTPHRF